MEGWYTAVKQFETPKRSEWTLCITPDFTYTPLYGNEPNRFHRWMQGVLLGWKWERRK